GQCPMGADLLRDQPAGALPKLAPKQELIEAQSVSRRCGPRFSKRRKQMTYSKILNHGCRIQLIPPLESFETDSPLPLSLWANSLHCRQPSLPQPALICYKRARESTNRSSGRYP